jgi:uncharacterized protein (TIGR00156 family)
MYLKIIVTFVIILFPFISVAQFTGPVADRAQLTVEQAREARVGTYAVVTGQIINQLREDYYTFQDDTGDIRIEIASSLWNNREVSPQTAVRLYVEVDSNLFGRRYLWVESLEVLN